MLIIIIIATIFCLYSLKSYIIQKILSILLWERIDVYDLTKEIVLTERLTLKSGVMEFFEPCVSFNLVYKGYEINEKLIFHKNINTTTHRQRENFLQRIEYITLYINPRKPTQYYIIKPETQLQFLLLGGMLYIFAWILNAMEI